MAFTTIKDVAREAGVSVPTVSQVINNTGRISDGTRRRVLDAIAKLNYIPNSAARSMRSSFTRTIGLLVPDIGNSYFSSLMAVITRELAREGYVCLTGSSSESLDGQDRFLRSLLSQRIDGAILVPQGTASSGLKRFLRTDLPVVFLDRSVDDLNVVVSVPLIDSDPEPGIEAALKTISAAGHDRIGFIHGPVRKSPNLRERQEVFLSAGARILGEENAVVARSSGPATALSELLRQGIRAFLFGYSPDAVEAIRFFRDYGLSIGRDVSMVSFDDIPLFELASPAISVISQQPVTMAEQGVRTLLALLECSSGDRAGCVQSRLRIPTEFISRQSVAVRAL